MKYDPRSFTAWWLDKNKIVVDERGTLSSSDKRDFSDIFETLFLDYLEMITQYNSVAEKETKVRIYKSTEMQMALNEFVSLEMAHRRAEIISKLTCTGNNLGPVEEFIKAATGDTEPRIIAVMAHFIWMIKRKLLDKDVVFHIMPILYGIQGSGKTYAIKHLIEPLKMLTLELRLTEIADARFYFALNKNFVAFLDEMAGASKTDVDVLKNQITASHNDARKLGKNSVYKLKQNCSLIGATNRPVSEIIHDPTGARRFYEIRTLDKMDWPKITGIDYIALYQGIDENLSRGYIESYIPEITKDQISLIGVDELENFVEEYGLRLPGNAKELSCATLYKVYRYWAEENGVKPLNSAWFGRKLNNKSVQHHQRRVGHKIERFYMISEDAPIHKKSGIGDPLAAGWK